MAASTHIGEDEIIAETFIKLKENHENLRLVIVPRHPERSASVLKICQENGIKSEISSKVELEVKDKIKNLCYQFPIY